MPYLTVGKENGTNVEIYYKDWGSGQPIVFSHGWPLSADDRDAQKFYYDLPAGPFYGFNRSGAKVSGGDLELVAPRYDGRRQSAL
jgi:non-heme chloroperoxidase